MCGLIGAALPAAGPSDERWQAALASLNHRGPDHKALARTLDGRVVLGHTRLSIIDLHETGNQPMWLDDSHLIVFNGEIYNHRKLRQTLEAQGERFRSESDTEVILRAYRVWGPDCVQRFVGMFAFVLLDIDAGVLFGARDRAGEKPLFLSHTNDGLFFASEVKALLELSVVQRKLDHSALQHFLAFGCSPPDHALLKGVDKLPAGHQFTYSIDEHLFQSQRYWQIPEPAFGGHSDEDLLNELETRLADSVALQMVADVPIGVLLSGGVDSSLVTALAIRSTAHVRTFTLVQPNHADQCEASHAVLIANHFGTEHTELRVDEPDVHLLDRLARQYDDPIGDSSMIPTFLITEAIARHCKVAVGGDGGDELFGGYRAYNLRLRMAQRLKMLPRPIQRILGAAFVGSLPIGARGRGISRYLSLDSQPHFWPINYSFSPSERRKMLRCGSLDRTPEYRHLEAANVCGEGVAGMTRTDFAGYLVDDLLVKVDRASMLNSLEVRAPLLDHRLIEFAFRDVPDRLKANQRARKVLLKRLCSRLLPERFDQARKQGFSIPYLDWLKRPVWREYFRETLLDAPDPIFNRCILERYLAAGERGTAVAPQLFALVMLERWRAIYGITL